VVRHLRGRDRPTLFDLKGGNLKRQMKKAADVGVRFVVIVGDEFARGREVTLRDMTSGEQVVLKLEDIGG